MAAIISGRRDTDDTHTHTTNTNIAKEKRLYSPAKKTLTAPSSGGATDDDDVTGDDTGDAFNDDGLPAAVTTDLLEGVAGNRRPVPLGIGGGVGANDAVLPSTEIIGDARPFISGNVAPVVPLVALEADATIAATAGLLASPETGPLASPLLLAASEPFAMLRTVVVPFVSVSFLIASACPLRLSSLKYSLVAATVPPRQPDGTGGRRGP